MKNEFYVFSIVADVADTSNFIYDHPLYPKINQEKLSIELESFQHNSLELIDLSSAHEDILEMGIGIDITNFYTSYTVIGYAGDINFKDFYVMAGYVQDMD